VNDRLALLGDRAVRSAFGAAIGWEIEHHATLGSTQDRARELARAGGGEPLVVVADQQTSGHGRGDKTWLSEPGTALLASWIVRPAPAAPALFALLAGVAVVRALRPFGVADLGLKWPNDVWLSAGKLAGCLAHGSETEVIIGIGVNVGQRSFPPELAGTATSLARAGHAVDRLALLARLSAELRALADPAAHPDALAEWRRRSITLGREVEVAVSPAERFRGRATALDDDGALVVETAYGQRRVLAGEVRVLG
jgi:BirA family biotin operon repressor/biotin-[acetyl-CoA-carboxylase] ligase